jgi:murein DD-endopeptidase MepM/ murein hydrolase activator NlpD
MDIEKEIDKIKKETHIILISNKKQVMIILTAFVLFWAMIAYINFRPAFLKVKDTPAQIAELRVDMNDGFGKIFKWQDKQDSINEITKINMQHLPTIFPVASANLSNMSSKYGIRINPITKDTTWHRGIDINSKKGTPVFASAAGRVIYAKRDGGYGNLVVIDSGNGITTKFGHLNSIAVMEGQIVYQGEIIGTVGSTGKSTGNHLHYEILNKNKSMNPYMFY